MALAGNMCMVRLSLLDTHLHICMYFLFSQFSLVDLIYICTTVPKMASGFPFGNKSTSFTGSINHFFCDIPAMLTLACGDTQVYEYTVFLSTFVFLLFPFMVILGSYGKVLLSVYCMHLQEGNKKAYSTYSTYLTLAHTVYILCIPYCRSRTINHFFCNVPAMLTLACGDTRVYEYTVFLSTFVFLLFPFMVILGSYGKVLLTVYHMPSQEGRKKAYSTCSSHLTVVSLFYAPFVFTYLCPKSFWCPVEDKVVAVFYTILTPMLNPVIYSLRNKEVLGALKGGAGKFFSTRM
ncbi:Olfactory receptor 2L2 [Heterocephalus glaber]|uniref:Olfactory receptor 2L2 n=1 Tax=Heterocephalus glaber TaxID=10181 RepID=G5BIC5_HETGA|nr:Olfactory receptor 2L2 [Heterocephalus glaber]